MTFRLAPKLSAQLADIQCILGSGMGTLTDSAFWLLEIHDAARAREWLRTLRASGLVASVRAVAGSGDAKLNEAAAVGFSHAGLLALGIKPSDAYPFPTPFCSGMGSPLRKELLNDAPRDTWCWSDAEGSGNGMTAHILLAHWFKASDTFETMLPVPDETVFASVWRVDGQRTSFRQDGKLYEPFGFRDGIAQPVIHGLREQPADVVDAARREAGEYYQDRVISPGEFILGYRNEYDELAYCPDVKDWDKFQPQQQEQQQASAGRFALNGSYLAVRQIEQDVSRFQALEQQHGVDLVESMMGRSKSGLPLGWSAPADETVPDSKADAFRFRVEDANGFVCPMGSHIRRVNPRDSLGIDVESGVRASKLHRLLRRGRPYLKAAQEHQARTEGLFFIACNADLERQFEFVHQRWVRNPRFGNLHREDDPIIGAPFQHKRFTVPGFPCGQEVSFQALTHTVGGGYFFLPGLSALEFIAR